MSNTKTEAGHKSAANAATGADKPQKPSRARKSAAHSRPNAKAARPDHAKSAHSEDAPVSRSELLPLNMGRWLIVADNQDLEATADWAVEALASTERIFLMAGEVVAWDLSRRSVIGGLRVLDQAGMAAELAKVADSVTVDRTSGRLLMWPSPEHLAKLIHTYRPYGSLPVLKGVVIGSAKRPDGTMITKSGYDDLSGLLVVDVNANPAYFEPAVRTGDAELDDLLASLG